jgi:hypothetical protein
MAQLLWLVWLLANDRPSPVFSAGPAALRDRAVVQCFAQLVRNAKLGRVDSERAAFLVLHEEGVECMEWPAGNDFRMARWSGPRPRGVVAIAHTHPLAFPAPSDGDIDQAKRSGISIFVLTAMSVRVIHADGRTERLADNAEWMESHDGR